MEAEAEAEELHVEKSINMDELTTDILQRICRINKESREPTFCIVGKNRALAEWSEWFLHVPASLWWTRRWCPRCNSGRECTCLCPERWAVCVPQMIKLCSLLKPKTNASLKPVCTHDDGVDYQVPSWQQFRYALHTSNILPTSTHLPIKQQSTDWSLSWYQIASLVFSNTHFMSSHIPQLKIAQVIQVGRRSLPLEGPELCEFFSTGFLFLLLQPRCDSRAQSCANGRQMLESIRMY